MASHSKLVDLVFVVVGALHPLRAVVDYENHEGGPEEHQAESAPELALDEADPVVAVVAGEQCDRGVCREARAWPVGESAGVEVAELSLTPPDTLPSAGENELALVAPRVNYIIHVIVASHERLLSTKVEVTDTFDSLLDILNLLFFTAAGGGRRIFDFIFFHRRRHLLNFIW